MQSALKPSERQTLLAAQEEAIGLLVDARTRAEAQKHQAAADALALVLEQQVKAERLLAQPQEDLIAAHRTAVALLRAEAVSAAALRDETERKAVEILLTAQREAAAILLRARVKIEEARSR